MERGLPAVAISFSVLVPLLFFLPPFREDYTVRPTPHELSNQLETTAFPLALNFIASGELRAAASTARLGPLVGP